ncbi:hypothetical protein GIB67_022896 [Kingdonia uniflora]|uniref:Uncharacterized protein n=1 Tax=Kingdonia uniflora TaxID=39325 RepID=A0A7J7NGM3_9MAGN|nr:hypothetical protein GIB67_022896 [Kingdonia uniflora]
MLPNSSTSLLLRLDQVSHIFILKHQKGISKRFNQSSFTLHFDLNLKENSTMLCLNVCLILFMPTLRIWRRCNLSITKAIQVPNMKPKYNHTGDHLNVTNQSCTILKDS